MNAPMTRDRVDAFAELISQGLRMCEAQAALGMTKGEACATMRRIRNEMGSQAV